VDVDTNGIYTRMRSSGFTVGQGGYGGPKGPSSVRSLPQRPNRKAEKVVCETVDPKAALLFRLNGDTNPLHASPENGAHTLPLN